MMRLDGVSKINKVSTVPQQIVGTFASIARATCEHAMTMVEFLRDINTQNNNANQILVLFPENRAKLVQVAVGYLTVSLLV